MPTLPYLALTVQNPIFPPLHSFKKSPPQSVEHLCNQMGINLEVMIACKKDYSSCTEFRTKIMILFVQGLFYSTLIWMLCKVMETPFKWVPNCIYTLCVYRLLGVYWRHCLNVALCSRCEEQKAAFFKLHICK